MWRLVRMVGLPSGVGAARAGRFLLRRDEFRHGARDGRARIFAHQLREMFGGVVAVQDVLDVERLQFGARRDAFGRHGDAADPHGADHREQRQVGAVEQRAELLADQVQQIALRQVLPEKRMQIARPAPGFFAHRHGQADEVGRARVAVVFEDVVVALAKQRGDVLAQHLNVEPHEFGVRHALFGEDVFERAAVSMRDELEVVAGRFEQAHEHGHAHIVFGERFHARDGGARDAGAARQFLLRQVAFAPHGLQHVRNVGEVGHL